MDPAPIPDLAPKLRPGYILGDTSGGKDEDGGGVGEGTWSDDEDEEGKEKDEGSLSDGIKLIGLFSRSRIPDGRMIGFHDPIREEEKG